MKGKGVAKDHASVRNKIGDGAAFHGLPKPQHLSHGHGFAAAWARLKGTSPAATEAELEQPSDHHPSRLQDPPGMDPAAH